MAFNQWGNYQNPWSRFTDNGFDFQQTNEYYTAAGPIYPSTFVALTARGLLRQATTDDLPIGIVQQNTYAHNTNLAADTGGPLSLYGSGQDCWLLLGGNVSAGDKLKSDNDGRGVKALRADMYWGAYAYQSGSAGQLIRVKVLRKQVDPPCGLGEYSSEYSIEFGNCPPICSLAEYDTQFSSEYGACEEN